jgi:hypothetical protein
MFDALFVYIYGFLVLEVIDEEEEEKDLFEEIFG